MKWMFTRISFVGQCEFHYFYDTKEEAQDQERQFLSNPLRLSDSLGVKKVSNKQMDRIKAKDEAEYRKALDELRA